MIEEAKVTVYRCDAPGCRVVYYRETDEPPLGYHGHVMYVCEAGGNGGTWFACKPAHIRPAVMAVSERRE